MKTVHKPFWSLVTTVRITNTYEHTYNQSRDSVYRIVQYLGILVRAELENSQMLVAAYGERSCVKTPNQKPDMLGVDSFISEESFQVSKYLKDLKVTSLPKEKTPQKKKPVSRAAIYSATIRNVFFHIWSC